MIRYMSKKFLFERRDMKTIRFNSCVECPCRTSVLDNKGEITVICDRLSKSVTYMDWMPDKLDEFTLSLLQFPRDCPIKDDPVEEEEQDPLNHPETSIKDQIADLMKQSRKLTEEGKIAEATKFFNQAFDLEVKLFRKNVLDLYGLKGDDTNGT